MFAHTDQAFATAYYHWFFLIQPFDLPERLIGADPTYYLRAQARAAGEPGSRIFDPRALAEYDALLHAIRRRSMRRARTIARRRRSTSSTTRDDEAEAASNVRCSCCGARTASCTGCSSRSTTGAPSRPMCADGLLPCGHYLAEEVPDETLRELKGFFAM